MGNIKGENADTQQRQRLEFVEARLFWIGWINRRDITEYWGVSGVAATKDLQRYELLAPGNMRYDVRKKAYLRAENFKAVLTDPSPENLMRRLVLDPSYLGIPAVQIMEPPTRTMDQNVLCAVLSSIVSRRPLDILYHSLTKPEPTWRTVVPRTFGHDGRRWHVRAYCTQSKVWKDYVIGRILETGAQGGEMDWPPDEAWDKPTGITLQPDPRLDGPARAIIERDFGMSAGSATHTLPESMAYYFRYFWHLGTAPLADPLQQQVVDG